MTASDTEIFLPKMFLDIHDAIGRNLDSNAHLLKAQDKLDYLRTLAPGSALLIMYRTLIDLFPEAFTTGEFDPCGAGPWSRNYLTVRIAGAQYALPTQASILFHAVTGQPVCRAIELEDGRDVFHLGDCASVRMAMAMATEKCPGVAIGDLLTDVITQMHLAAQDPRTHDIHGVLWLDNLEHLVPLRIEHLVSLRTGATP